MVKIQKHTDRPHNVSPNGFPMSSVLDVATDASAPFAQRGRPPLPPGPRGLPGLGVAPHLARDLYRAPQRFAARWGDVVSLPVPSARLILINHPEHVTHVFNKHAARYEKGEMNAALFGDEAHRPLPISDGDTWKRMRKLLNPKFGARELEGVADLIADAVVERVERWQRHVGGAPVDFDAEWSDVTMSVLLRSMFSTRPDEETIAKAVAAFRTFAFYGAFSMLGATAPSWLPMPYSRRGPQATAWIHAFLDDMIAARHRTPLREGADLLSMMMQARYEDGEPMSDLELRSELMGLIFGGFETTSSALSWTIALLDLNPDAAASAYDEVDALGGTRVQLADLERLPFLRACFDEAQRLQGGPMFSRSPLEDDEIGGYLIPRGSIVAVSPYTIHRDPRFWREPDRFDPTRFLDGEVVKNAFIPFGLGPRKCMGMRMAYIEALFALVTALQRHRFRLAPGFVPEHHFHVSTGMKGGCPLTVHPRRAVSAR